MTGSGPAPSPYTPSAIREHSGSQLAQTVLFKQANVKGTDVPFDSGKPALTALLGNQVEVTTDYMSAGNKLVITAAAEEQAKTGHDAMAMAVWEVHNHARGLEPVTIPISSPVCAQRNGIPIGTRGRSTVPGWLTSFVS